MISNRKGLGNPVQVLLVKKEICLRVKHFQGWESTYRKILEAVGRSQVGRDASNQDYQDGIVQNAAQQRHETSMKIMLRRKAYSSYL